MPGRTADEALRRDFERYEHVVAVANARRAALLAALFMFGGTAMDWIVYPGQAPAFLGIRSLCAVLLAGVHVALGRLRSEATRNRIAWAIPLVPTAGIGAMIAMSGGGSSTYYAGLNLVMVGLSLLLRWSFRDTAGMVAFCFLTYFASVWMVPGSSSHEMLAANVFFLLVTGVFVVAGSYYYERLRFREFALRRELEDSRALLETRNRQLSELDEAKTRFFANISHELRTPLTVIIGATDRLSERLGSSPDREAGELLSMAVENGLRLLKLIDDLLDLVRFDTGHEALQLRATDPFAMTEGLMASMRHLAVQNGVELGWKYEGDRSWRELDRDKVEKVLINLVANAIKFTPPGGRIDVEVAGDADQLRLVVRDTGVGIPAALLPRVFERFWQADSSSTRRFQGTGIGLALVRGLVDAMQGSIDVRSGPGKGTVFRVELPAAPAAAGTGEGEERVPRRPIDDLHRRAALSLVRPAVAAVAATGSGRPVVLVADDEPDIRRHLAMQLAGMDVIEAADGPEALEAARRHRPMLALIDHMMPGMNGVEVCRAIRAGEATAGLPVILLTARADERTKIEALEAGATDFLTKPFSATELMLRVRNQLAMESVRRELAVALDKLKKSEVLLVRNEKLSGLGQMSAGIIHEINNPLNYVRAGLHALGPFAAAVPESGRADFADILGDVSEGVERVVQIVSDLRQFTGDERRPDGAADLADAIARARRLVGHSFGERIAFDYDGPPRAPLRGNANQLVQVFVNLFRNAVDAIVQQQPEQGGRIEVVLAAEGGGWRVTVKDNGCGIPAEAVPRVFDPFFTSKEAGQGTGLGLSITHQILNRHRARIDVASEPGRFTCFTLTFPAAPPAAIAEVSPP